MTDNLHKLTSDQIININGKLFIKREIQRCQYCHFYKELPYGELEDGEVVRIKTHNTCMLYKSIKSIDPEYAETMKHRPYTGSTYIKTKQPEVRIDPWTERDVIIPGDSISFVIPCKYRFEDDDIESLILSWNGLED